MESICLVSPESIASLVGIVIAAASGIANFFPAPAKIDNKVLRALSRVVHFVAFDVTTSLKKK
jgi:hypothetical protein